MNDSEFQSLMTLCKSFADDYPTGLVFIGGIAIYLHAINSDYAQTYAEFTHDADFYISLADMSDLRGIEDVIANKRLDKHQLIKGGFEFDIYTERLSGLIVPFDEIMAHCTDYDGVHVTSLEHLLVLKLEAYKDRHASMKGDKDARDIAQIAIICASSKDGFRAELCTGYLTEDHLSLLHRIPQNPLIHGMAQGNSVAAKKIREALNDLIEEIDKKLASDNDI